MKTGTWCWTIWVSLHKQGRKIFDGTEWQKCGIALKSKKIFFMLIRLYILSDAELNISNEISFIR